MLWQKHADIIKLILTCINQRSAPTHVVKVKSHRGVYLNEQADIEAGKAAAADSDQVDTRYPFPLPPGRLMLFTWKEPAPKGKGEISKSVAEINEVFKKWKVTSDVQVAAAARLADTMGGSFLLEQGWGHHLYALSRRQRAWTTQEERRWQQMVGRVFPVNPYLHRIGKHTNGECKWCKHCTRETLTHFQSQCPQFTENRIAAHHLIVRAVVAELRNFHPTGWQFFYETPLNKLPFHFKWASEAEKSKEENRRPDCVAWNPFKKTVLFMEFTRAMDHPHTMREALAVKTRQYSVAAKAFRREHPSWISKTTPLIFGVRGSVITANASMELRPFALKPRQLDKVLAAGVRAAITGASDMATARMAAITAGTPARRTARAVSARRR